MKLLIGLRIMCRTLTASMAHAVVSSVDGPGSPPSHANTITQPSQDEGVGSPTNPAKNNPQTFSEDSPVSHPANAENHASKNSTNSTPTRVSADTQDTAVVSPHLSSSKRSAQESPENVTAPPTKKMKAERDVMYLHDINEQVHDKTVNFNLEKCLPDNVKTAPVNPAKTAKVWRFYLALKTPICEQVAPVKKRLAMTQLSVSRSKTFTHVCLMCLKDVVALGDKAHEDSWNRALCKVATTSNAEHHLSTMHPNNSEVMLYLNEKKNATASKGALDSGLGEFVLDHGHDCVSARHQPFTCLHLLSKDWRKIAGKHANKCHEIQERTYSREANSLACTEWPSA